MISVVIATYNRAPMVEQTVRAALEQTRPPHEIVVLDDASTDATPQVLAELAAHQPCIRLLRREVNSGGIASWNEAIGAARGDYLAFCADDDRFLPDHLKESLAYLEADPSIGLVHSSFIDVVETGGLEQREPRRLRSAAPLVTSRGNLLRYLTRYYDWPFHPSTMVLRREVWSRVGEYNPAYALADTEWFVRVVEQFDVAMLPRHGVLNRRHPGNWSNRLGSARMQKEIFEIVEGAIGRLWAGRPWGASAWRAVWRANVRLRLGLTLAQRVRTGHEQAACAAWHGIVQNTGRRTPEWLERAGVAMLHGLCSGRVPRLDNVRQRVSPL